jgi:hypothetical protein
MFDAFHLRAGDHHHHHRSEVHEHRAPTDDSVKLLREMEHAALERVLSTIRLEGSPVDCAIVHMRDHLNYTHKFLIRYQLGRHKREVRHDFQPRFGACAQGVNDECHAALKTALAEDIAFHLLTEPFLCVLKREQFNLT